MQLKPLRNIGISKRKKVVAAPQAKGDLFIVGPWVKKAGKDDFASMRDENSENMNASLNWHADDVLEFALTMFNPLYVDLPLTKIELFVVGQD